jgi:flagellar hook-associated protein 1 FlgK
MLGLFGTLNLAARSLQAQMTGMEVTGQNLANVNTTGYTRQRVELSATSDIGTYLGPEGTGVEATSIQQTISAILNQQIQNQSSVSGYWTGQQSALQNAQNGLNEYLNSSATSGTSSTGSTSASSTGLAAQLTGLFNAFQGVATSPTSTAARQTLVSQAQTVATSFNQVSSQLSKLNTSLNTTVGDGVTSANKLLSDIASLNKQISTAEFSGGSANDLRDEREQDLESLGGLVNFTSSTGTDGSVNVSVGGQTLVAGQQLADTLQTYTGTNGNAYVQTATGGVPLTLTGGSIQGTIEARDGSLATLQGGVDTLASTLITQVNSIYSGGYSMTGSTGANFFNGTNAGTITVNASLTNNPSLVQASGSATATGDNSVALQLAQLASSTQAALGGQTFLASYTQMVGGMGTDLQTANNQVSSQTAVAQMLSTQKNSVSGVSVDEEMTNMMTFQKAYEASSEVVKTVDQMLETTLAMKT